MRSTKKYWIVFVTIVLAGWLSAKPFAAEVPSIELARLTSRPVLDGDLSDACWKEAARVSNFYLYKKGESARFQTEALVGYDKDALYVAFRCIEPDTSRLQPGSKDFDKRICERNRVEVFLSPGTERGYYHFMVSTANTCSEQRCFPYNSRQPDLQTGHAWDGDWSSAVKIDESEWTVEVAIPWYNFGEDFGRGTWRLNLCRDKKTEPKEISSWSYQPDTFHDMNLFGNLATPQVDFSRFQGLAISDLEVTSYDVSEQGYSYLVKGVLANTGKNPRRLLVEGEDCPKAAKGKLATLTATVPANNTMPFELAIPADDLAPRRLKVRLRDAETGEACYVTSLTEDRYPQLMKAWLDRNYYTKEKKANAVVSLNIPRAQGRFSANLEVRAQGDSLLKQQAKILDPQRTSISVDLSRVPVGVHHALVRVTDDRGWLVGEEKLKLRKHQPAPAPIREVKTDRERGVVLVDGKPFFPIGIYRVPQEYMKEVADAGFNSVIFWDFASGKKARDRMKEAEADEEAKRKIVREYLDAAHEAGLMVVENPKYFNYKKTRFHYPNFAQDYAAYLKDPLPLVVETSGRHPALLAYYGPDEPGEEQRVICRQSSEVIWEYDPYHPVYILYSHTMREWPEVYEIAGVDTYAMQVGFGQINHIREVKRAAEVAKRMRVPFWHVPVLEALPRRTLKWEEQRLQGYLSVIGGAKGIFWFVWPPRHKENWEAVKEIAGELSSLSPILLDQTPRQEITVEPSEMQDALQVLVKEHRGRTYLITANTYWNAVEVDFQLPGRYQGRGKVWFEDRIVKIARSQFSDRFPGYGTHVYELRGSWPEGGVLKVTVKKCAGKSVPVWPVQLLINQDADQNYLIATSTAYASLNVHFELPAGYEGEIKVWSEGRTLKIDSSKFSDRFSCYQRHVYQLPGSWPKDSVVKISVEAMSFGYGTWSWQVKPEVTIRKMVFGEDSPNLLRNSSFEKEIPSGWPEEWIPGYTPGPGFIGVQDSLWGTDQSVAYHGEKSLRMTRDRPKDDPLLKNAFRCVQTRRPVEAGKHYTLSVYLKADRPDLPVQLSLTSPYKGKDVKVSTEWSRYTVTEKVVKPGYYGNYIYIKLMEVGTIWIDAVQLEEGEEATPYQEMSIVRHVM